MEPDMNSIMAQTGNQLVNQIYRGENKIYKKIIKNKTYPYLNISLRVYKRDIFGISPCLSYLVICPCSSPNSAVNKYQIEIFDIKKSRPYLLIPLKSELIRKVCFSFDEKYMIIGYLHQDLEIWDINKKRIDFAIQDSFKYKHLCETISCSNYNLGFVTTKNTIQIWSFTEKSCTFEVYAHQPESICFSPDGQLFAFLNVTGSIKIINMKKEIILSIEKHQGILAMAFSQDSEIFVFSLLDKNLIAYNIKSKNEIFRWSTIKAFTQSISFSPDGDLLQYFDFNGVCNSVYFLQNFKSSKIQKFQKWGTSREEIHYFGKSWFMLHDNSCNSRLIDIKMIREQSVLANKTNAKSLAFSPDSKWLAIGMNLRVKIVCISDNKKNWEFDACGNVKILRFSADSRLLGFWNFPFIEVRNVSEKYTVFNFYYNYSRLISFDISHDNKYIAFGSKNCISVSKIDGEEKKYERLSKSVWSVEYNKENVLIAVGCDDNHIQILDVNQNQIIHSIPFNCADVGQEFFFIDQNILVKLKDKVLKIDIKTQNVVTLKQDFKSGSFSHDKKLFLCYSNDRLDSLIDVRNECSILSSNDFIDALISGISAVCDRYFAVAHTGRIYLSDIEVLVDEKEIINNFFGLRPVYISKNKAYTIKPTKSSLLQVSESKNPLNSYEIPTHSKHSNSITLSKDSLMIAFASNDKSIEVWNLESKEKLLQLSGHSASIISLSFSFDGKSLVSGSWDSTVRIWDLYNQENNFVFNGHKYGVNFVCFDRVGKILASNSFDRYLRIWNVETRMEVKCLKIGLLRSMCFERRNKYFVAQVGLYAKVYRFGV